MATKDVTAALLPVSRRLDWRFLLPEPVLGDVVCLQPVASSLAESLQIFSASLATLTPQEAGDPRQRACADLLVACDPSREALSRTTVLLKPGAYIYVEAQGIFPRLKRRARLRRGNGAGSGSLWRPETYRQLLRDLGFTQVQAYWHWPNFERCKMMIPLKSPAAAQLAFDRGGQSVAARLKTGLGRAVVSAGLLAWVVPYFSVTARWEQP